MSSIRKCIYATLLALTTLSVAPSLASGQQAAQGKFTLPHDVHWENAVVPAGSYQFSVGSDTMKVLRLDKISGAHAGFMFLVRDEEPAKSADISRLLLDSTPTGSYVSSMQLPEFGMTLNFTVPASTAEKQMARAATVHSTSDR